ncbi:hypothetical protein PFDG_04713 [Plasmodium falciparum Dd2]|uniref:Uncharacterized protein n=1 Tax=Plasmodium falciparum (isolate Dd2) TaxID=57267 RepID=A0A0L7M980_PLAF4|nr:hypothetical protein PFDG_04713 [Plasmodium falciparum Dd2]
MNQTNNDLNNNNIINNMGHINTNDLNKNNTGKNCTIVNTDEFVNNVVKMLQVIYEFIFLCIRIYDDDIIISKLFGLPYTIVSNVNMNNDTICEEIIGIMRTSL